jgi:hypothetical protein
MGADGSISLPRDGAWAGHGRRTQAVILVEENVPSRIGRRVQRRNRAGCSRFGAWRIHRGDRVVAEP